MPSSYHFMCLQASVGHPLQPIVLLGNTESSWQSNDLSAQQRPYLGLYLPQHWMVYSSRREGVDCRLYFLQCLLPQGTCCHYCSDTLCDLLNNQFLPKGHKFYSVGFKCTSLVTGLVLFSGAVFLCMYSCDYECVYVETTSWVYIG